MPRISAENRSGAAFRAGAAYREPPGHLTKAAKALWTEIVEARAVDYFAPGSFELLEQYCELTMLQRKTLRLIAKGKERDGMGRSYISRAVELSHALSTLATKLRMSIQAGTKSDAGKINEKGTGQGDRLLGGAAVWASDRTKAN